MSLSGNHKQNLSQTCERITQNVLKRKDIKDVRSMCVPKTTSQAHRLFHSFNQLKEWNKYRYQQQILSLTMTLLLSSLIPYC